MSNVLIGIIGVILFIGLALAGALILGDDFRTASSASKASAVVAQMQQMAAAINMYEVKTGQTFTLQDPVILVPRFLKSLPVNPMPYAKVDTTYASRAQPNNDLIVDQTATQAPGSPATYVTTKLGNIGDTQARDACQSIADVYNEGVMTPDTLTPSEMAGCMAFSGANGGYIAWARR